MNIGIAAPEGRIAKPVEPEPRHFSLDAYLNIPAVHVGRTLLRVDTAGIRVAGIRETKRGEGKESGRLMLDVGHTGPFVEIALEEGHIVRGRKWRVCTRGDPAAAILEAFIAKLFVADTRAYEKGLTPLVLVT